MHAFLLGSITLGLLSIKTKISLSNFAAYLTLLYSMGSLVILMRSRIVSYSIFNLSNNQFFVSDTGDDASTGSNGICTKLSVAVAYYLLFYFLFHIAIALCYIIAIVCLLLHDSIGISTTCTVVMGYILS